MRRWLPWFESPIAVQGINRPKGTLFQGCKALLPVLPLLFAGVGQVRGDFVVYSNFGPGQSYDTSPFNTYQILPGQFIAESFSGNGKTFSSVSLALGYDHGTNSVIVSLRADNGNAPGALLESFTLTDLPPHFSGGSVVTATDVAPHILLTSGTAYWIEVAPGDASTEANWFSNSTGAVGFSFSTDQGASWHNDGFTSAAFEVDGVDSPAVAPVPSSLALGGTGIVSLAAYLGLRRRRQVVPA